MERRGHVLHYIPFDLPQDEFLNRVATIAQL